MDPREFLAQEKQMQFEVDMLASELRDQQKQTSRAMTINHELKEEMQSLAATQLFKDIAHFNVSDIDVFFRE